MVTLIIGTPASGKSACAERIVTQDLSNPDRFYLATMIPYGAEGAARIVRHRAARADKGFVTLEVPFDIERALEDIARPQESTVLLECLSNLVANELFERRTGLVETGKKILSGVARLAEGVRDLVVVTNHFPVEESFDAETLAYAALMDRLNDRLAETADTVIRIGSDQANPQN